MKRSLLTACAALALVYALPLCTLGLEGGEKEENPPASPSAETAAQPTASPEETGESYDERVHITLLRDGQVEELALGDYLEGVLAAEMPASFPPEALKAQAVAARTYTLYKLNAYEQGVTIPDTHQGAQLCDDFTHCKAYVNLEENQQTLWGDQAQEYREAIREAVESTDGMVVTYEDQAIAAVFHAASSGKTEDALDVWGTSHPYLVSVDSPGEEACPNYYGTVSITPQEFAQKFWEKHPEANFNDPPQGWFRDSQRSQTGGIIHVLVGGVRVSGSEIRTLLGLNSTNFTLQASDSALVFSTVGYGHGVGLSQYGARELALEGKTFDEILKWYYKGTEILLQN